MAQFDIPDDFDELSRVTESEELKLATIEEEGKKVTTEIEAIHAEKTKLREQLSELTAKQNELVDKKSKLTRDHRQSKAIVEASKRKLSTFASERELQRKFREETAEFDDLTRTHKWREWARPHQLDGARRLASAKRAICGDKRGLGKTLQSIIYMDMLKAQRILVIAPGDTLGNFKREMDKWAPYRPLTIIKGMPKPVRDMFFPMIRTLDNMVVLVNFEAWRRDPGLLEHLASCQFDTVIIDEAHDIKTSTTNAFKGVRQIIYAANKCSRCGEVPEQNETSLRCPICFEEPEDFNSFCSVVNVLPMTGTPILNKPQDLWSLLNLLDRVNFPSEKAFLEDYCRFNHISQRWRFASGGEERLTNRLGMRYVARDADSAGVVMPPQSMEHHWLEFDPKVYPAQWRVMQEIKEYQAIKMSEDVALTVPGALAMLTRRRQAITWPAGIKIFETVEVAPSKFRSTGKVLYEADAHESIKIDKAMEIMLQAIEEGDRVVLFSQFKEALKELERRLNEQSISVIRYDGDLDEKTTQEAQLDFDTKTAKKTGYRWQVFLGQYKKAATGLNLNAARQMVILDREWNPGKENQATGRIQRLDTTHETIVHVLHVEQSVDSVMDEIIEEKQRTIDGFEESASTQEKLFKLLKDADLL